MIQFAVPCFSIHLRFSKLLGIRRAGVEQRSFIKLELSFCLNLNYVMDSICRLDVKVHERAYLSMASDGWQCSWSFRNRHNRRIDESRNDIVQHRHYQSLVTAC